MRHVTSTFTACHQKIEMDADRTSTSDIQQKLEQLHAELTAPLQVLVVDDDRTNLVLMTVLLENLKCIVTAVDNIEDAMTNATGKDLVLLDVMMPGDGVTVLKFLRNHDPHIPVVLVTALDQEMLPGRLQGAVGFVHILFKPIEASQLDKIVKMGWSYRMSRSVR